MTSAERLPNRPNGAPDAGIRVLCWMIWRTDLGALQVLAFKWQKVWIRPLYHGETTAVADEIKPETIPPKGAESAMDVRTGPWGT